MKKNKASNKDPHTETEYNNRKEIKEILLNSTFSDMILSDHLIDIVEAILNSCEPLKEPVVINEHTNSSTYVLSIENENQKIIIHRNSGKVRIIYVNGDNSKCLLPAVDIPFEGLKQWNKNRSTNKENEWLTLFSKELIEDGDKVRVQSDIENMSYDFELSSGRIYFTRHRGDSYGAGSFQYIKDEKLITGQSSSLLSNFGDLKYCEVNKYVKKH